MQVKLREATGEPVDFHECVSLDEALALVAWLKGVDVYLGGTGEASGEVSVQVCVPPNGRAFVEVVFSEVDEE